MNASKDTPVSMWRAVEDENGLTREDVPREVPLIVSWKEHPYPHLHLKTTVAWCSGFDGSWADHTGETISQPTHWQQYMSLEQAIELGKTDNEANWDSPQRLEAHRIRREGAAERDGLRAALKGFLNIAAHCEIKSGVCGCGEDMANHSDPMSAGHSPTDMADQVVSKAIADAEAALAKAVAS